MQELNANLKYKEKDCPTHIFGEGCSHSHVVTMFIWARYRKLNLWGYNNTCNEVGRFQHKFNSDLIERIFQWERHEEIALSAVTWCSRHRAFSLRLTGLNLMNRWEQLPLQTPVNIPWTGNDYVGSFKNIYRIESTSIQVFKKDLIVLLAYLVKLILTVFFPSIKTIYSFNTFFISADSWCSGSDQNVA